MCDCVLKPPFTAENRKKTIDKASIPYAYLQHEYGNLAQVNIRIVKLLNLLS